MLIRQFINTLFTQKLVTILCRLAHSANLNSASFIFYFGEDLPKGAKFELGRLADVLAHPNFDANSNTTLYAHGFAEKQEDESIRTIVSAYIRRGDQNLIVLDWTELASGNYLLSAVPNTVQLSNAIASDLLRLFERGLTVDKLHLVGHSLGGQLVGRIGRNVINLSNRTVVLRRITALDPAFPGFYPGFFFKAISANDAKFVDVIHTDSGIYGAPFRTGTVDFCPNGGITLQPGCPSRSYRLLTDNDLCSHRRSWTFWAESVANKYSEKFNAIKAQSWYKFKLGATSKYDPRIVMGIDCPENIHGKYYLTTNDRPPFARGSKGTMYHH